MNSKPEPIKNNERHLDPELLIFYLTISIVSAVIYILKHPVSNLENRGSESFIPLIIGYMPDLIIFLAFFIPFILIILILLVRSVFFKCKIYDSLFLILFFPLFSFFIKSMSLLELYSSLNPIEVINNNVGFFVFMFLGPAALLFQKFYRRLKVIFIKNRNKGII